MKQRDYDAIPFCPRCKAICEDGMDFCHQCGRKITHDHSSSRRAEQDMVDGLKRNFGHRLGDWLQQDANADDETLQDIIEFSFEREAQ